jgi:glyoxylase-like metal-dependent hydrolase (beta-lactamase superfamily II)
MKQLLVGFLLLFSQFCLAENLPQQDYQTVQVANGIYAFIATEPKTGVVQGNVVLVIGDEDAVVVDSGQYPTLAERMVREIKTLTPKPVRVLVNTHWHRDHLLANHVFRQAFTGLKVVTHSETKKLAEKNYADWEKTFKEFPTLIKTIRERVATGKRKDGTPLTEMEKFGYTIDSDYLEAAYGSLTGGKYETPDITFEKEVTFYLGKREVKVMNLGPGNTPGDAILYVPDSKTLITGDTVVFPTPYSFGSYHSEWIDVLKKMIDMNPAQIVPGHGPVMKDASYLKTLIGLLEDVRTQVRAAVQEGLTLDQTRKKVNLDKWRKQLAGEDRYRRRAFLDFFETPGIAQAYKEAKGESRDE